MLAGAPWRRGWPMRRGKTDAGRGADAGGWGLPGRDATGRAHRCVEASGRGVRQANARLATACTAGKEMHEGRGVVRQARRCKIGNRVHGWQGNARRERCCTAGKEMQDWQPRARLASGFTIGRRVELALDEQMHDWQPRARLATRCTMEEAMHGWQADSRLAGGWNWR